MMIKVIHGDCISEMQKIDHGSIDLTVTSPPYDNLRTYNGTLDWGEHIWKPIIKELFRITKDGGVVVWVVNDATIKGSETGTSFKQALYAMECGFNLHDTMIWNKNCFSAVGSLRTRYSPVFEYMFVFSKTKINTFNLIKDRKCKSVGSKKHGSIRQSDGTMKRMSNEGRIQPEYGQRFNVWDINPQSMGKHHPAIFPEQIAHDHIISWSNEGDTIFDPFLGSGTTGKMAVKLNRKFIGIEKVESYYHMAKLRIEEEAEKVDTGKIEVEK